MLKKNLEFIYDSFEKIGQFFVKYRWVVIAGLALILAGAIIGFPKLKLDISTDDWLKEGEKIEKAQKEFEKLFGNNEYAAFLIKADDVFSQEILTMMRKLGNDLLTEVEFAHSVDSLAHMNLFVNEDGEIIRNPLVPDEIPGTGNDLEDIRQLAFSKKHIVNNMVTDDSKDAWLILKLDPFPEINEDIIEESPIDRVGKKILEILARPEYQKFNIKPTGSVVMSVEEMEYIQNETPKLVMTAIIVSLIVLGLFLRSFRGVIIPVISAVLSVTIIFGYMGHLGIKIIANLMSLPVFLTLVISIGYSIHIINIFKRQFLSHGKRKEAVITAVRETGWPIFFTAMTTIGALSSFSFIALLPLQWLGLVCASLIFCAYLVVMILTPILLSFGKDKIIKQDIIPGKVIWTDKYFKKLAEWVYKNSKIIMVVFLLVMVTFTWGATRVEIGSDILRTYGNKMQFVKRILEITESEIGYFYSYNVSLNFKELGNAKDLEVLKNLETFTSKLKDLENVKKVDSCLHLFKNMNQLLNGDNPDFYTIPENIMKTEQIYSLLDKYKNEEITTLWISEDQSTFRIKIAASAMTDREMRKNIASVEKISAELFPGAELNITGMIPTMVVINTNITEGLIKSLFAALMVILILLMIVFRSIKTGFIGMIPNITPVIIVGGTMGIFKIPLDFMTMTMLPMILGLAVDDTIHFITHANVEYNKTKNYQKAIETTLFVTGRSLFMTSFIIVAAFAIYFTADMQAQVNFGLFITLGIISALLADYLITPVCMKWFKPFGK